MAARDALIVAVADYSDVKLQQLRAPATDAERLRSVLEDPDVGAFSVDVASDEDERALRRRLALFFSERKPSDLLLVHFSCHGVKDDKGELYLAASDTDSHPDLLAATAIASSWLNQQIERCRSKRIVLFLDCCFSGSFRLGAQARSGGAVDVPGHLDGRGRVVITASNAMEYSMEGKDITGEGQPSVFTGALVEALESGRADRDGDGQISIDELYDYVLDRVREQTPSQTPMKLMNIEGPLYIARSSYRPPVEVAALDPSIREALESPLARVRVGAVEELAGLLTSSHPGVVLAAREALEQMAGDDSQAVSRRVAQVIGAAQESDEADAELARREAEKTARREADETARRRREAEEQRRREAEQERARLEAEAVRGVDPAGALLAAAGACLLFVSLFLEWRVDSGATGTDVVGGAGALTVLLLVVLALAADSTGRVTLLLRHSVSEPRRSIPVAGVAIVLLGAIAIEAFVLQSGAGNGSGRMVALVAGAGIVLGGWLALVANGPRADRGAQPTLGELAAGAGALLVIGSLFLPWDDNGSNAWTYSFSDIVLLALAATVAIMVAARLTVRSLARSAPAMAAILVLGLILSHRIGWLSNIVAGRGEFTWEAGRIAAMIGALAIVAGGLLSAVAPTPTATARRSASDSTRP